MGWQHAQGRDTLAKSPGEYKAPAGEMVENKTWLDRSGNFIGSNTTVTEKFTLVNKDHIDYEATISDPELYTKDWKIKLTLYRRMEPNAELMDFRCVPIRKSSSTGTFTRPHRPSELPLMPGMSCEH